MRWKPWLLDLAAISVLAAWLATSAPADNGQAGGAAPYLREGVGAAALGMGNAQTGVVQDATAAYWNPAALARLRGSGAAAQTAILGDQRSWHFLNYSLGLEAGRNLPIAFGASWEYFSAGNDLEARFNNRPEPDRIFGDQENTFLFSGAIRPAASLALGANIKMLSHTLDDESGLGFGSDLAAWLPWNAFSLGLVMQDVYSSLDWSGRHSDRLPTVYRLGAGWAIIPDRWQIAADGVLTWSHAGDGWGDSGFHLGTEYWVFPSLAIRAGLDRLRFTAGAGVKIRFSPGLLMQLDYALAGERLPGAGLTHVISLVADFPRVARPAQAGE